MSFPKSEKIWMNGKLVPWDDAKIHIGSHVIHYGSAVFEGVRCYATPEGPAVFRLDAHTERLYNSAKIYRMDVPYTPEEFNQAVLETIAANRLDACYIRPIIYRGYGQLGVNPFPCPVDVAIMVWDWGKYLGTEALEKGVDVRVSSWTRMAPNTLPAMAKSRRQLHELAAHQDGGDQGGLRRGHRARLRRLPLRGQRREPLPGAEGHAVHAAARVLRAARHHPRHRDHAGPAPGHPGASSSGCPARCCTSRTRSSSPAPRPRSRPSAPSTRSRSDEGARGPVTEALQRAFFDVVECRVPDEYGWLTFVREGAAQTVPRARCQARGVSPQVERGVGEEA